MLKFNKVNKFFLNCNNIIALNVVRVAGWIPKFLHVSQFTLVIIFINCVLNAMEVPICNTRDI